MKTLFVFARLFGLFVAKLLKSAISGGFVTLFWNYCVSSLFNVPFITFWFAWGSFVTLYFIGDCFRGNNASLKASQN